jgi:hypothetical protein
MSLSDNIKVIVSVPSADDTHDCSGVLLAELDVSAESVLPDLTGAGLGRFLNRTSLNYSDVLRQVSGLCACLQTDVNGGVRWIFARCATRRRTS